MASTKVTKFVEFGKKIVAVGRNFSEHAAELGNAIPTEPIIFLKPTSAYVTEGNLIKIPKNCQELHHEVELGLVIGKMGANIPAENAMDYIGGYALALDMTNRGHQTQLKKKGQPWSLAKGFDTSCPISDFVPKEKIPDPGAIQLWCKVNNAMRQDGNTKDMIFTIPNLISFISEYFTLEPGDLILTGTPAGVGPVKSGDTIEAGLENVVRMSFTLA
ncbi:acylpyruvase FAHD1, mitochondrial-like [Lineus longissimus]|uniref:acylpyruvase FAHD1, mitochondrial-like n=1 Tax=Lineus longissimus TaxID=88925 RepID=UPI002B4EF3F1